MKPAHPLSLDENRDFNGSNENNAVLRCSFGMGPYIGSSLELVPIWVSSGLGPQRAGYWFLECEEIANRELFLVVVILRLTIAHLHSVLESVNLLHGDKVRTLSQQVGTEAFSIESHTNYCQAAAQEGEQAAAR